jgi:hypothetical protein
MWYYTEGQKAKIGGMKEGWFVAKKKVGVEGNDILVVPGQYALLHLLLVVP